MITIKYTINAMRSLSGARSVELNGKHNDDDYAGNYNYCCAGVFGGQTSKVQYMSNSNYSGGILCGSNKTTVELKADYQSAIVFTDVTRDPQGTRCKVPCGYLVFCPHVSWQVGLTPTVWRYVSVAPM